jgi:apolipoprotein N-acyltransferase
MLVVVNALIAGGLVLDCRQLHRFSDRQISGVAGAILLFAGAIGVAIAPQRPAPTATAVLIQPNLDVGGESRWNGPGEWDAHMAQFAQWAAETCGPSIAGIPQTGAPVANPDCAALPAHPDLVAWPESPAPFDESDPRFQHSLAKIAQSVQAPIIVGSIGWTFDPSAQDWNYYNSALVIGADGARAGRYDKIHLVPFGEYIPFQNLLTFAHKLTGRVSRFTRGDGPKVFRLASATGDAHHYGVFICYEAVFADEVRHFAQLGADVLVNISDDGWYGDTSAPWQHLNMVRMRAVENRRWILRSTNNGITAVIDPYGQVRQSIPRHQADSLAAQFAYRDDVTFYTAHGDVFGWTCALLGLAILCWSLKGLPATK